MKKVTNFKLLTLLLMLCTSFLSAQTDWNGGGDGTSWEDPLNWTAGIPGATDRVNIGAGNTVVISSAAEAESVANFGDLTIQPNHSLTIIGASAFDGIFNQGTVINKGTINLDNSGRIAIFNRGNFTNDNLLNIGQNVGLGDITLDGIRNSSVFNNHGHMTIDNTGERGIRNDVGGAFTNTGTLDIGQNGGAGNIVSNGIVNDGLGAATFTNDGGTINISNTNIDAILNIGTGTFNNNGCAALLNLTDARITNGGTFNNNLGTIIENASDNSEISTNSGTVQNLNGGTFTIGSGNAAIEATGHIWTGCLGTDWDTPGNWHTGTVPAATDDVTIPNVTTNDPIISTAALAKSVTVQTDASLTVNASGSLTINGFTSHTAGSNTFTSALFNEGTVTNNGNITLGSTASVGTYGIYNQAIFNNNSGEVKVDRSTGAGIWNFSGTFTNTAAITIGGTTGIGSNGIWNRATFNNNNGGEVKVDRSNSSGIYNNDGTFTNSAAITIGGTASVGTYGIYNQAIFTNNNGEVKVDRSTSEGIFNESGTFTNSAAITIGGTESVGTYGIYNLATFNNNSGEVKVDRSITAGIGNESGTFTNTAAITIGGTASVGDYGIENRAIFNNNGGEVKVDRSTTRGIFNISGTFTNSAAITIGGTEMGIYGIQNLATFNNNGGEVKVDRSTFVGIWNSSGGTFTNSAAITIGGTASVGSYGIQNQAIFNNNGGKVKVDRSTGAGIWNYSGTFTNTAAITIGGTASVGTYGIWNQAIFTNNGGEVKVDRSAGAGIRNNSGTFTNTAAITIGGTASVGTTGIENESAFDNTGCAALINIISDATVTNASGTFSNSGTIIENASDNSEISTNSGIVQNLNGGTFTIGSGNAAIEATGHIWTGCIDTDWDTPGNWHTGTVPTATDDVTIPDVTTNDPIISTAALAKSVTVQTDASLEVSAAGSLTINGSAAHSGLTSGLFNEGTVTNNGNITLGSTASVGTYGIYNQAIFNNNSGEVKVDRSTGAGIWNFSGTFTNTAAITIGGTAGIGSNGIWNRATFNNNNGGEVKVDRSNSSGIYNNDGTFINSAAITIGGTASVGTYGIYNQAIFTNNNGEVKVDRSITAGIWNESGTFTNSAAITIGSTVSAGTYGIFNRATFNNNGGGINIDDIVATGILNGGNGLFTNQAEINIGAIKAIGVYGIYNGRNFTNGMSGEINIDDTGNNGIVNENSNANFTNQGKINIGTNKAIGSNGVNNWDSANFANEADGEINIDDTVGTGISNSASIFTNEGKINIGADKSIGGYGVSNTSTSNFTNETGGEINIDRSTSGGIFNNIGTFTNEAAITIGAIASVGANGIENRATFNNNTCAEIYLFDNLNNSGTFTNAGLFTVNTTQTHTNSALTNNGIIAYPQGNPIPNVTNNEIVIAPTTANACDVISPAFDLGSPVDFTIAGIFTDEAATLSAGTYETATNTFTPTVPLAEGSTYSYFVQIMDPVGGCTRVLPWDLTTENCITLSGNIVWEHDLNTPVTNANVTLSGNDSGSENTDANGDYAIPTAGGSSLTLTPSKTGGEYEGVDVADVTRIQQHVTFIDRFDDGYKAIAADVNQSNSVTGLDAAVIFHAINGNPNAAAIFETPSWRFVDSTHTFMDENAPWPFPEDISLMNVMSDVVNQSFVGVKMGDVNGTWATPTPLLTSPLNWTVPNLALKAGQTLRVPFRANGLPDVAAWQFALRFDTDYLRFERALPTAAFPLKDENFGAWQAGRGELRSVFAVPQGLALPKDEVIFELEFQIINDGAQLSEVLRLDNGILDGRVYNTALNGGAVALSFEAVETRRIASILPGEAALGFALEQNIPNPFSNETLVRFELPEAGEAVFSVHDVQGRLLYEQRGFLDAGQHEVRLDAARLGATGVLSYTLQSGKHSATRRMVLVR